MKFFLLFEAIFFPPIVAIHGEYETRELVICSLLTLLGWLPGVIYAAYLALTYDEHKALLKHNIRVK